MGLFSSIFGGTQTYDVNTAQTTNTLNDLMNQNYDWGLGKAGKVARGYLGNIKRGEMDQLPSVQLAMAQGSNNWKNLQRQLSMQMAGQGGNQPGLQGGLLSKGFLQNQDQTGMAALQGAANDISNFSNIYNQARGQQENSWLAGQQMRLGAAQAGQKRLGSTPGILGGLAELGKGVGAAATGIGAL